MLNVAVVFNRVRQCQWESSNTYGSQTAPDVDGLGSSDAIASAKRKTRFPWPGSPRTQKGHCLRRQVRRGRKNCPYLRLCGPDKSRPM